MLQKVTLSTQGYVERESKILQRKSLKADGVIKHGTKTYRERNKRKYRKCAVDAGSGINFITVF
jgi:hypothetical protein